jgi:membrane-bound metal-dependent hydrolase YbcI (DUF457 family)
MWPPDHLVFGYVCYSLLARTAGGRPGGEVYVLAVGTQAPDLLDKPLGWWLGVTDSGFTVGHSVFVAAFLTAVALPAALRTRHRRGAVAFLAGLWSHLLGDVLFALALGRPGLSRVLWPLGERALSTPREPTPLPEVFAHVLESLTTFEDYVLDAETPLGLFVYTGLLLLGGFLWIADGRPGLPDRDGRLGLSNRDDRR